MMHKDHKVEPEKGRAVATATTSNTTGLSNAVSDYIESLANSIENPIETISTEDMLHRVDGHNREVVKMREEFEERREEKMCCKKCKIREIYCQDSHCQPGEERTVETVEGEVGEENNPSVALHSQHFEMRQNQEVSSELSPRVAQHSHQQGEMRQVQDIEVYGGIWKEFCRSRGCYECIEEAKELMKIDCEECGEGINEEDLEMCILGLDVVGLFPAMKSKNSGKILRRQAVKGPLKVKGFKWKHGTRYIRVNKHLTGDLSKVAKFLPWRRFSGGVAPGMTSEEANSIDGDVEKQWCFPRCEPNEQEEKEIIARCAEIATRTIFENFCYKFGGKTYQQSDGGPIGARVTMCLARVVMHDWGEQYQMILTKACLRIALLGSYVDDVRQGTTVLRLGMRFDHTAMEFKWSMKAELEDTRLKEIGQEPTNRRMARTCLPAMNAINPDLVFTAEVPEDFGDGKLPTLDFKTWHIGSLETESQASFGGMPANSKVKDYRLNHSYFEKEMRTPYVIMKRSAMSDHSRYNILANELVRRLSNMKREETTQEEKEEVVEHFIQQCKTSGYSRHETREGVISGLKGWKRKCVRRERDGVDFYRSGRSTLGARTKKKLTEKSTWYKKKRKREEEEEDDETAKTSPRKKQRGREGEGGSGGGLEVQKPGSCEGSNANKSEEVQESAIAVIMVPFTKGAELAKRVRQYEMMAREQTGWYLKVVERAGDSLTDLLHRSDPWSGEDCQREACLHCETKLWSGKYKTQDCSKRNCIYETWCRTCQEREEERIEEACGEDEERKREMKKKIKLHKYVGETSRSVYERAWEHTHSRDQLQTSSHMLKHIIEMHGEEENPDKIQFGVRVVRYTRRAFERQIMESVFIQEERSHFILNSKSEYNRCSLPRLTSNLGNREWKKRKKEEEEEKEREAALERVITTMRKERNNRRKDNAKRQDEPAEKRRKIGEEEWKRVKQTREIGEKRREREEKEEENPSKRRKTNDIRNYIGDKIGSEEKTREQRSRWQEKKKMRRKNQVQIGSKREQPMAAGRQENSWRKISGTSS